MVFGLEHIAPAMSPPYAKVFFTSCWLSFAVALVLINLAIENYALLKEKLTALGANIVRINVGELPPQQADQPVAPTTP